MTTVWQDNAQITVTYGDRARTVLNNHRAKLYGTGLSDETALDYVEVVNEPMNDPPRQRNETDTASGNYFEALGGEGTTGADGLATLASFPLAAVAVVVLAVMSLVVPIMRSGFPSASRPTTLPRLDTHL